MKPVRINLIGGPSVGKDTTAMFLCSELKAAGYQIEFIPEWLKTWVWNNKQITHNYDQLYVFCRQLQKEFEVLRNNISVITSSPLIQYVYYASKICTRVVESCIKDICDEFNEEYPSLNIYLKRHTKYCTAGRYHTEKEAIEIDSGLNDVLIKNDWGGNIYNPLNKNSYNEMYLECKRFLEQQNI